MTCRLLMICGLALVGALPCKADAPDGAFGIVMGTPLSSLKVTGPSARQDSYFVSEVPRPHPLLTHYSVRATSDEGVCYVSADSGAVSVSRAMQISNTIEAQLTEVYGEPQSDRLGKFWIFSGDVKEIAVSMTRPFSGNAAVVLYYRFKNFDDCSKIAMQNPFKN